MTWRKKEKDPTAAAETGSRNLGSSNPNAPHKKIHFGKSIKPEKWEGGGTFKNKGSIQKKKIGRKPELSLPHIL